MRQFWLSFRGFTYLYLLCEIYHFTIVYPVTWPLNGSKAGGGDLVLIQSSQSTVLMPTNLR